MADTWKLEPEYFDVYGDWLNTQSPESTAALLLAVDPLVKRSLSTYPDSDKKLLRGQAKAIILSSLKRYDPNNASLRTYLAKQLQGLNRKARAQTNVTEIPERKYLELYNLNSGEQNFYSEHGRYPSTTELADFIGMSPSKIKKLRQVSAPVSSGIFDANLNDDEASSNAPGVFHPVDKRYIYEYVLSDLSPIDQVIAEHDFQLHGQKRIGIVELAKKLGISTGNVSARRKRLTAKMQDASNDLFGR